MSTYTDASLIVTPNSKKAGKLYALKGADLDVVRATTATYVGADGLIKTALANEVRFDYTNGSCPSILVEPQRTNLLLRSEEFDNAYWSKVRTTIIQNSTIAPDGSLTADKLVDDTTALATHQISRSVAVVSGLHTMSIFAKKGEYNFIRLWEDVQTGRQAFFNLDTGVATNVNMNSVSIEEYSDGWFRCIATINIPSAGNFGFRIILTPNGTTIAYDGTGANGVYIWGAQLEAGANATSYIPTVASAVTRNADVISKTGISSLIGQTEGTIFANINIKTLGLVRSFISIQDASYAANALRLECTAFNQWRIQIRAASVTVLDQTFTSPTFIQGNYKIAFSYSTQTNGLAFYINGVLIYSTTISTLPTLPSRIYIGTRETSSSNDLFVNDSYNLISLFKTRLTNEQLAQLTTI